MQMASLYLDLLKRKYELYVIIKYLNWGSFLVGVLKKKKKGYQDLFKPIFYKFKLSIWYKFKWKTLSKSKLK
jgi:hypothetical protein